LAACKAQAYSGSLACSDEPLAFVLRQLGWEKVSRLIGLAAFLALPSVILMMIYGQTRIFFCMARDRLLPDGLTTIHPRFGTPYVVTMITGAVVILTANGGTLFAFCAVALGVMLLRIRQPDKKRPFRTPLIWVVGPLAMIGCLYLFFSLPLQPILVFLGWAVLGLVFYRVYGYKRSALAPGSVP
jgi:APA family basic amino acid/polyamine antiporter